MQVLFEQKDVKLVYDVQEPVYAWANEFKMEQVLNNYISNALNHVDGEKIIKITIQRQDGHVRAGVFNTCLLYTSHFMAQTYIPFPRWF